MILCFAIVNFTYIYNIHLGKSYIYYWHFHYIICRYKGNDPKMIFSRICVYFFRFSFVLFYSPVCFPDSTAWVMQRKQRVKCVKSVLLTSVSAVIFSRILKQSNGCMVPTIRQMHFNILDSSLSAPSEKIGLINYHLYIDLLLIVRHVSLNYLLSYFNLFMELYFWTFLRERCCGVIRHVHMPNRLISLIRSPTCE